MEKDRILQLAKSEKTDEGRESAALGGVNKGFGAMSLLFALFYVSCAIKGKRLIWREALLCMYMCFFSSIGYTLYKFEGAKRYLVQCLLGGVPAVILSLATLYWIWLK